MRVIVHSLLLSVVAAAASAQYYVRPVRTPNTDARCAGCANRAKDQLTPGYPAALGAYLGRYVDSSATNDCQQPVRTLRAVSVIPSGSRLYFQIGSAVYAYDTTHFLSRVAAGEQLASNSSVCGPQVIDIALQPDHFYYAERQDSGWDYSAGGDGQTRLYGIDADDQGYVYLATKWYRWGIVKDDGRADGSMMTLVSQPGPFADDVIPLEVAALKGASGTYYAVLSDVTGNTLEVFDVTNRANPQKRSNVQKSMYRFAKNSDATRVAITTTDGKLEIYTTDMLVAGGQPIFTAVGPFGAPIRGVASDGVNFYAATDSSDGLLISSYAPDGAGYRKIADLQTSRFTLATDSLTWGGGYLTQAGFTDGTFELRLFHASTPVALSEVDLSIPAAPGFKGFWFRNFYVSNSTGRDGYTGAGVWGQFHGSAVITRSTGTYLIVTAFGLGDVFQLDGTPGPPPAPQPPAPSPPTPPTPPAPIPPPARPCPSMNNLFIYYGASTSGCSYISSAQCATGEEIAFNVGTFGYDLGCAAHVIAWNFGDQSGSSSRSPTHVYRSAGTYPVSLTISSPYEFTTRQVQVKVGGDNPAPVPPTPQPIPPLPEPQPCQEPTPPSPCPTCQPCPVCPTPQPVPAPVPPLPVPPFPPTPVPQPQPSSNCPVPVVGQNIDLFYSGDTCASTNGEPCDVGEPVTFSMIRFPWFSCGSRSLAFDYGDGSSELTTDTGTRHRFTRAGTYEVRVTVSIEGRTVTIEKKVEVQP